MRVSVRCRQSRFLPFFLLIFLQFQTAFSQSTTVITGKVLDETGKPLKGASVAVKDGTTAGSATSTNADGSFTITAPPKPILLVTYVGFVNQEVAVTGNTVSVTLKSSAGSLNDVVVIGYGTVRKRNVIGSVSSIGEKEITDRPIARVDQALAGQMPGVQVQSVSGAPGAALQIRVRGSASVSSSNDPIYVLDGIIIDDLSSVDPNTIQSIDVLKDASSAAIYGARGSNGVVLITTKRGKRGKPIINLATNFAVQRPEKLIDMLSPEQWIQFRKDITDSNWVTYGRQRGLNYTGAESGDFRASELNRLNPTATRVYNTHAAANPTYMYDPYWAYGTDSLDYVDWQKRFYSEPGLMQKYSLSASGANENTTYLISGEYLNQDGMVKGTGYNRFGFRANLETKINKAVTVGLNLNPSISNQNGPNVEGRGSVAQPAGYTPIQEKGVGENAGVAGTTFYRWNADNLSPMYIVQNTLAKTQLTRVYTNIYLNAHLANGLDLRTTGAWNSSSSDYKNYTPTSVSTTRRTAVPGSNSSANRNTSRTQYYLAQSVLTFNRTFGDHEINALAGISYEDNQVANTLQSASKFPNDNLYTFDNAASTVTRSVTNESDRRLFSLFSRALYSYKGRYLLSASVRRDGSSRFGANSLFGSFPAASAGWRISDENFMQFVKPLVSEIKLRYSWGIAGNDRIGTNDYPSIGLVTPTSYSFNGQQFVGYSQTTINSPDLKWEKTTSNNWGIDVTLLRNRINVSLDYFTKLTKDLLLSAPVAYATGFATENKNIGSVTNKGYELNISTTNISNSRFTWNTKLNFSTLKNKVVALANNNTPLYRGWENTVITAVGMPLIEYRLYQAIGVYTSPDMLTKMPKMAQNIVGDPIYKDVNGDGKVDVNDISTVGSPIPTYYYGMTNTFTFKGFDLSILFQGQGGNKIFSMFGRNIDRPTTGLYNYNAREVWANRFRSVTSPGDGVTPRIDATTAGYYDTRWLYDGAFWKIKNIALGYNLKTHLLKGFSTARIYASVDNVYMHDHYDGGYSPEAFQYDYLADWSSYPTARTFSLGFNLGF